MLAGIVASLLATASGADLGPSGDLPAFRLTLSAGNTVTVIQDELQWFGPQSVSLVGRIAGESDSSVVLSFRRGTIWGSIRRGASHHRIRSDGSGAYRVEPVDDEVSDAARAPITVPAVPKVAGGRADDGSELDVLVVYTPRARDAAGGLAAIESLLQLGVTEANLAFERSAVETRLRLVDLRELDYVEAGDVEGDLELLQRPLDGAADEVHALRNAHGADLVQLVVEHGEEADGCGIAYILGGDDPGFEAWAFSVVERGCVDAGFGLAHEIGHNLGCDHAIGDPTSQGAFDFSHGYKDLAAAFRTVMAYGPGRRVGVFSNPRLTFLGARLGTESSDNARSIQSLRATVANFRPARPRPRMIRPRGTALLADSVRFTWEVAGNDVAEWWLLAGRSPGEKDLFDSGSLGGERSVRIDRIRRGGNPVFLRLWYRRDTVWLYEDFVYHMP